jgi:hypothetical protein
MAKMPIKEASIIPPNTGVPTSRRAVWATPVTITNGNSPRMKANDVIMTGREAQSCSFCCGLQKAARRLPAFPLRMRQSKCRFLRQALSGPPWRFAHKGPGSSRPAPWRRMTRAHPPTRIVAQAKTHKSVMPDPRVHPSINSTAVKILPCPNGGSRESLQRR